MTSDVQRQIFAKPLGDFELLINMRASPNGKEVTLFEIASDATYTALRLDPLGTLRFLRGDKRTGQVQLARLDARDLLDAPRWQIYMLWSPMGIECHAVDAERTHPVRSSRPDNGARVRNQHR